MVYDSVIVATFAIVWYLVLRKRGPWKTNFSTKSSNIEPPWKFGAVKHAGIIIKLRQWGHASHAIDLRNINIIPNHIKVIFKDLLWYLLPGLDILI